MKKTLRTTLSSDITSCSNGVIEALKTLYREAFTGFDDVSFEIVEVDEEAQARRLLQSVHAEFEQTQSNPAEA